jgi:poly(hydroxyalkanoate) depolymerase family esterase
MASRHPLLSLLVLLSMLCGCGAPLPQGYQQLTSALTQVPMNGPNPGKLRMWRYVPAAMPTGPAPLVVVLHGCEQQAADMQNAGWNALADATKFYLVYPEQPSTNNPAECSDWFGKYNLPSDKTNITRGGGESESIKEMVDQMKTDFTVDASRVYVAGFSAGGGMATVVMADWPDVFSAGAVMEGLPYNCPAQSNSDVFNCMNPGVNLTAQDWGDRVRAAFQGYAGPWPRASLWEGTSDTTVNPSNLSQLVKQWTNVLGADANSPITNTVDGQQHASYLDGNGQPVVVSYQISGMSHGVAVDPSNGCGATAAYFYDEHICSTRHAAAFFGLVDGGTVTDAGADAGSGADGGTGQDAGADSGTPADAGGRTDAGNADAGSVDAGIGTVALTSLSYEDGFAGQTFANGWGPACAAGDEGWFSQDTFRAILSFDTTTLPSGATIKGARLRVYRLAMLGTVSALHVDIKSGFFGATSAVEQADYASPATASDVAVLPVPAANGAYSEVTLPASALGAINPAGRTQFRLRAVTTSGFLQNVLQLDSVGAQSPTLTVDY